MSLFLTMKPKNNNTEASYSPSTALKPGTTHHLAGSFKKIYTLPDSGKATCCLFLLIYHTVRHNLE